MLLEREAWLAPGFTATVFATEVTQARGLAVTSMGDVLVVARGDYKAGDASQVLLLWDDDGDGVAEGRAVVVPNPPSGQFTHGLALRRLDQRLYASSDTTVWSWSFLLGQRGPSDPISLRTEVRGINADGRGGAERGHWTRTLAFSPSDERWLFVAVGSLSNVDSDSFRSRIRRFDLSATVPKDGFDFASASPPCSTRAPRLPPRLPPRARSSLPRPAPARPLARSAERLLACASAAVGAECRV